MNRAPNFDFDYNLDYNSSLSGEDSHAEPCQEDHKMDTDCQPAIAAVQAPIPVGTPFGGPPAADGASQIVQLSTSFNFTANLDEQPPDTIIISSDGTLFAVHSHRLLSVSNNHFAHLLVPNADPGVNGLYSILVSEASDTFNIVLHTIYGLSGDRYQPSFECVISAIDGLRKYGLTDLHVYLSRGMPLFTTFLHLAIQRPFEVFSFASREDLEDLAVDSSEYTLATPLHLASHEVVKGMNPEYLMRLMKLHSSRPVTLKGLLDAPVREHAMTPFCSARERAEAIAAYRLSCARLYFTHSLPGITAATVGASLFKYINNIACPECKAILQERIDSVCAQWQLCKRTI